MKFVDMKNEKEVENLDVIPSNVDDDGLKEAYADANQNTCGREQLLITKTGSPPLPLQRFTGDYRQKTFTIER